MIKIFFPTQSPEIHSTGGAHSTLAHPSLVPDNDILRKRRDIISSSTLEHRANRENNRLLAGGDKELSFPPERVLYALSVASETYFGSR